MVLPSVLSNNMLWKVIGHTLVGACRGHTIWPADGIGSTGWPPIRLPRSGYCRCKRVRARLHRTPRPGQQTVIDLKPPQVACVIHGDQRKIVVIHLQDIDGTRVLPQMPEAVIAQTEYPQQDSPIDDGVAH